MIRMSHTAWWELTEAIFDDSAGEIDDAWIGLHFATPQDETLFCLRWLNM